MRPALALGHAPPGLFVRGARPVAAGALDALPAEARPSLGLSSARPGLFLPAGRIVAAGQRVGKRARSPADATLRRAVVGPHNRAQAVARALEQGDNDGVPRLLATAVADKTAESYQKAVARF